MAKATILPPIRNARGAATSSQADVDTLYTELADAERAHRAEQFWKRFGVTALAASLAVIIGTAGYVYYQRHTAEVLALSTSELAKGDELVRSGKTEDAVAVFAKAAERGGKLVPVLRLRQVEALVLSDKHAEALPILRELAHDASLDIALRDTARLSLARQTTDPEEMRRELAAAAAPGAPFAPLAQQMRAALAMAENKPDEALAAINAVDSNDADIPLTLSTRNAELRMVFTPNQAVNNPKASIGEEKLPSKEELQRAKAREAINDQVNKQLPGVTKDLIGSPEEKDDE